MLNRKAAFHPAVLLALGFGFFALASVSILISRLGDSVAAIWLANAFAVVVIVSLALPQRLALPVVAAACLAVNVMFATPVGTAALLSALNILEIGLAVGLIRWWLGDNAVRPDTPSHVVRYFIAAVGVAPAITAPVAAVVAAGLLGWNGADVLGVWLGGSLLGGTLIVPAVILARSHAPGEFFSAKGLLKFGLAAAGALLAVSFAFWWYVYPFFLIGMYLLAATAFVGRTEVALLATISGLAAITIAVSGLAPDANQGLLVFSGGLQGPLSVGLIVPVFVSVVLWRMQIQQQKLAQSEALFRAALENSATGMAIVELNGRISKANRALAEMLGYSMEELTGKTFFELSHPDGRHVGLKMIRDIAEGKESTFRFQERYVDREGRALWMELSCSVINDDETGQPRFTVAQFLNVDDRIKAQQAVIEAENRWNFALNSARQGVWDFNLRDGHTYYSPMWKEMLGYEADELGNEPDLWLKLIHPEDRARALQLDKQHLEGRTPFFEAEFRMRCKDGSWIWVLDRGKTVERDENGEVVRAIGTHTDITALKQAQSRLAETAAALKAEKERLRVTLHSIGDAVICTDAEGKVTFVNAAAEVLTGHSADDVIGKPLSHTYCPRDEETNETISVLSEEASEGARSHNRAAIVRPDGRRSSVRQVVSPIITEGEVLNGSVIVFQDVTDARTLQRQLAYAASHDSLTGLANRANFHSAMREIVGEAACDENVEHQLLFVDLDRFKQVNDTAGHGAGDALLKKISGALLKSVRRSDLVARVGGDEFALILKHCNTDTAVRYAENIVSTVSGLDFEWEGQRFNVGASIGIAPIKQGGGAVDEIVARADRSCYDAKSSGRGTVSVFRPEAA
ncbi:MAG: PAS domain S-box protein [Rhizobiaceae bacterium]|nr:PAS domain S-box protein [Rhizobiaceae bacterium]